MTLFTENVSTFIREKTRTGRMKEYQLNIVRISESDVMSFQMCKESFSATSSTFQDSRAMETFCFFC